MIESFEEINATLPGFFAVFAAIFGACVGSFLNVVAYRVPAGRSVVTPGSACACGQPIAWYDNIPVLSWFLLRGRARCCGARFSFRYPAVELLTAFLFWAAWQAYAPLPALAVMVAIGLFLAGALIDLDTMEIPDVFTVGGFIAGVILSALVPALHAAGGDFYLISGMRGFLVSLVGAFVGTGLILWFVLLAEAILRKEAMGFGDVKLMGAIGAFFGWQGAVFALFGGALIGTVCLLPVLLWRRLRSETAPATVDLEPSADAANAAAGAAGKTDEDAEDAEAEDSGMRIPFGPALVAGALVYGLVLRGPVDAYFNEFAHVLFP